MNFKNSLQGLGIVVLVGTLVTAALIIIPDLSAPTRADGEDMPATKDVVLVRCKVAGQQFTVSAYQGSVATPARKSQSCADTLADLNKADFTIVHVGYSDDADFVIYTITR